MNGTYRVTLITPFGPQNGTVTLTDRGGALNGSIHALGNASSFKNGKINGGAFEFSGILDTGFFHIKYAASGTAEGNSLDGTVKTDLGTFQIHGEKTSDGRAEGRPTSC